MVRPENAGFWGNWSGRELMWNRLTTEHVDAVGEESDREDQNRDEHM